MNPSFNRSLPVGLALSPIGFLFGVLAAHANWSVLDVALLGVFGFTGSGQFAFLAFAQQGVNVIGWPVIFAIILSMNLRYIPMSMSASQPLKTSWPRKVLMSHGLADESFAVETHQDSVKSRAVIRSCIFLAWVLSTVAGCSFAPLLPMSVSHVLSGLTFPASAILFSLSLINIANYVVRQSAHNRKSITLALTVLACVAVSLLLIVFLGERYFWLPGIAVCYLILDKAQSRSGK